MGYITQVQLSEILKRCEKWFQSVPEGDHTDLFEIDLSDANLSEESLPGLESSGSSIPLVSIFKAFLFGVDFATIDLSRAESIETKLSKGTRYKDVIMDKIFSSEKYTGLKIRIGDLVYTTSKDNFELVSGTRNSGFRVGDILKIGHEEHTLDHWEREVENIFHSEGYSDLEIKEYSDKVRALCTRVNASKGV